MGGSQVYLKEGEQFPVWELVKCVTIASANDAAVALAELERLAVNLQSGTPLGQALEVFCADVVSR